MTATTVLAFDTSGPWCAAALLCNGTIAETRVEDMARGQAERLMRLLEDLLHRADKSWSDLTAIGVGTGPGNFTGIRISVSAARGLAMGLNVPAIGIDGFEARAACHPAGTLIGIPAPRDRIYIADPAPRLVAASDHPSAITDTPTGPMCVAIARRAAARARSDLPAPAPLYVRPADAAPSSDTPPVILD